ncbi:hypothetical protein V9T40_012007 [Parthenolecanium corni]|uniref:DDE Tnp4 domain-containing protein n=1 Tax=Parthenolecanium corni TaxID=536013 RepID=A0AAN9TMC0_9HEMI
MHSGSEYFNYKSTFSIVLMVMCDGDYCITQANIGAQGRISDGGVFRNTELFRKLEKKELNLPNPKPLRDGGPHIPYVIVGDNAFPLTDFLMVPFRGEHDAGSIKRIFNYRLSRARRTVENVFGIMAAVFRILRKPILLEPNKARIVVQTCVVLHNFLRRSENSRNSYSPPGMFDSQEHGKVIPGLWRRDNDSISSLLPFPSVGRRTAQNPEGIRKEFAEYFMTVGRVEWQDTKA